MSNREISRSKVVIKKKYLKITERLPKINLLATNFAKLFVDLVVDQITPRATMMKPYCKFMNSLMTSSLQLRDGLGIGGVDAADFLNDEAGPEDVITMLESLEHHGIQSLEEVHAV